MQLFNLTNFFLIYSKAQQYTVHYEMKTSKNLSDAIFSPQTPLLTITSSNSKFESFVVHQVLP